MATTCDVSVVSVTLPGRLLDHLGDGQDLEDRISWELSELANDIGLPQPPTVDVVGDDSPQAASTDATPIRIVVDGRRCLYPAQFVGDALGYARGMPAIPAHTASVEELLTRDLGPETVETVALLCRAALAAQPGLLVGTDYVGSKEDIEIHVEPRLLRLLVDEDPEGSLFPLLRERLFQDLGVILPDFHWRPDPSMRPGGFAIRVNGIRTMPRIAPWRDTILVSALPEQLTDGGITAAATVLPATSTPASLVAGEHRHECESMGLSIWNTAGYVLLTLAENLRSVASWFVTTDMVRAWLRPLEVVYPIVGSAASAYLRPDDIVAMLQELLADRISIRHVRRIVELLLQFDSPVGERRPEDLMMRVRHGLADIISATATHRSGTLCAYLLDPSLEVLLGDVSGPADGRDATVVEAVRAAVVEMKPGNWAPVILTTDEARRPLAQMLKPVLPHVRVVGYGDLLSNVLVQRLGRIESPSSPESS